MIEKQLISKKKILSNKIIFENKTGIYFLIKDNEIVYVGQSTQFYTKLSSHVNNKDFDSYFIIEVPEEQLTEYEVEYIIKFNPIYNSILPSNNIYKTLESMKKIFELTKWNLKKTVRIHDIKRAFRNYYDIRDFEGVLSNE